MLYNQSNVNVHDPVGSPIKKNSWLHPWSDMCKSQYPIGRQTVLLVKEISSNNFKSKMYNNKISSHHLNLTPKWKSAIDCQFRIISVKKSNGQKVKEIWNMVLSSENFLCLIIIVIGLELSNDTTCHMLWSFQVRSKKSTYLSV